MKIELNIEHNSLERIWVYKTIAELWFDPNDKEISNSINATSTFLQNAHNKALKTGYVSVTVKPVVLEATNDDLEQYYIEVQGYRQETDKEYMERLKNMRSMSERNIQSHKNMAKFYESEEFIKRNLERDRAITMLSGNKK